MLPTASQTAGPNGLNFFVETHELHGEVLGKKNRNFFFNFFLPRATTGPSADIIPTTI